MNCRVSSSCSDCGLGVLAISFVRLSSRQTCLPPLACESHRNSMDAPGTRSEKGAGAGQGCSMAVIAATEPTVEVMTLEDRLSVLTGHVVGLVVRESFAWR